MAEFFHLWTSHDSVVVQTEDGELAHVRNEDVGSNQPVIVWHPSPSCQHAVLLGNSLGIPMRAITGMPITQKLVGLIMVNLGDAVALAMTPGRYFCAPPRGDDPQSFKIIFGRTRPDGWETFFLRPTLTPPSLGNEIADVLAALRPILLGPLIAARIPLPTSRLAQRPNAPRTPSTRAQNLVLRFFHSTRNNSGLQLADPPPFQSWEVMFQAFFGFLPHSQIIAVASDLCASVSGGVDYTSFAYDPWLQRGLPDLLNWLDKSDRRPTTSAVISHDLDAIAKASLGGTPSTLGHVAVTTLRKLVAPSRKCCIVTTARNEGLYFLEWVAHHKLIGFDHIFVYSNSNDDGSDELLDALSKAGEITWISNELAIGVSAQDKAYAHALSLLPDTLDFEWTAIIDLDEFIMLDEARFSSMQDYLAWQERRPTDAIALPWLIFGANGQVNWTEKPVLERFPKPSGGMSHTVKTICRTNLFFHSQPHFPITDVATAIRYRDSEGSHHRYDPNATSTAATERQCGQSAWVAHYVYKSTDELLWKSTRNRGNYPMTVGQEGALLSQEMVDGFNSTFRPDHTSEEHSPSKRHLAALGSAIQKLRDLPDVVRSIDVIVQRYESKISRIRDQIGKTKLYSEEVRL